MNEELVKSLKQDRDEVDLKITELVKFLKTCTPESVNLPEEKREYYEQYISATELQLQGMRDYSAGLSIRIHRLTFVSNSTDES